MAATLHPPLGLWFRAGVAVASLLLVVTTLAVVSPARADAGVGTRSGLPWDSAAYNGNGSQAPRAEAFGQWRGRPVDYMMEYATRRSWSTMDDFYDQTFLDWPGGHIIAIPTQPKGQDNRETASGARNGWWEEYGRELDRLGLNKSTTIIRLNWESTGGWYDWRVTAAGGPDAFIDAYNNVVTSVRVHAPEVKFALGLATNKWLAGGTWQEFADRVGPNEPDGFDYIELDGYDQYPPAVDAASWERQSNQDPGRNSVLAYAESRQVPMWYGEWNVSHKNGGGADNPYYVERKYEWILANAVGRGGWLAGETAFNAPGAPSSYNHTLFDTTTGAVNPDNEKSAAMYRALWSQDVGVPAPEPAPDPTSEPAPDPTSEPAPEPVGVDVTATRQSDAAVLVEWTGVEGATGYRVGRDGTDATGFGEWSTVDSAEARSRVFDKLLLESQVYTFTVTAMDGDVELATAEAVVAPTPTPTAAGPGAGS